jgi:kynurenine formamidase
VAAAPTEAQVREYMRTLSNWGRWGKDDELGTINLITAEKRAAAARLVKDGVSVTCARPWTTEITPETTVQGMRFMVDSGEGRDHDSNERILQRRGAAEFIGMVFHGYAITHVDAPPHYFWQGQFYNGRSSNLVTSREGATVNSVEVLRDGVVSRGVLLDVARAKNVRWMGPGEGVMPEDLEAAEKAQGVRVESGDILLVRTGYYARRLAEGPVNPMEAGTPALHVASCPWLRERGVAMVGTDTHNDIAPLPYPALGNSFHVVSLVAMGLWLIDNMNLEEVARAAGDRKRWEFLLTVAPLRLKNVTGSPVNPIALF